MTLGFLSALRGISYLGASMLFILSLRGLSNQQSARGGNLLGMLGMALAVVVTGGALVMSNLLPAGAGAGAGAPVATGGQAIFLLAAALIGGGAVGALVASRVAMTSMPELVAMLHSFVGAAAVLVGIATTLQSEAGDGGRGTAHLIEIFVGVFVGAVTFSGSVIAFTKLRGLVGSRPLMLPGRHALNGLLVGASIVLGVMFVNDPGEHGMTLLLSMTALALVLGVHLVMAIGGGDMPVVVSLLNSYSGWAAAAAGFMLSNDLLIVTGALVGSSGAILSTIMCRAMNRSIWNVVFGGFGAAPSGPKAKGTAAGSAPAGVVHETSVGQVAQLLLAAHRVVIVPGYGMAVAQAQHAVKEISSFLIAKGIKVEYAIHPVAGRLPGHMNVLLAEANVSYEIVKEMEEVNPELPHTDVVMVIGANDIVNPSALDDTSSPIYGMPVIEVWKAAHVVMLKRSMSAGYAGVDNPLAYRDNTLMLFGDARQSVLALLAALQS